MTNSPISTISYNSEEFLKDILDTWIAEHRIQAYQYIKHKGEDGDKDHIHLRIEPNKRLDPMDLSAELREWEEGKKEPKTVRPWRPSKEEDWILYAIHDKDYLRQKYKGGEKGEKLPYQWENIVVSEFYDMEIAYIRARQYLENTSANIIKLLEDGKTAKQLITEGKDVFRTRACVQAMSMTSLETTIYKLNEMEKEVNLLRYALINANLTTEKKECKSGDGYYYVIKKLK